MHWTTTRTTLRETGGAGWAVGGASDAVTVQQLADLSAGKTDAGQADR
ncbi:hypothetical protein ACFVU4_22950 [Streptomyces sp. NPDC058107]